MADDPSFRIRAERAFCSCDHEGMADGFTFCIEMPIREGRHTQFLMERCSKCGKMAVFPKSNALMFIHEGSARMVLDFYNEYLHRSIFRILWHRRGTVGYIVFFTLAACIFFNFK